MLGILGGMGPLATVDFMQKIIIASTVGSDQEHMPMVVHNVPQIPDRSACILSNAEDPFPALKKGLISLEASGAKAIVMPCNTAHFWFDRLTSVAQVPMISIINSVAVAIAQRGVNKVGVMATSATVAASIYDKRLSHENVDCLVPDNHHQQQLMDAIYQIKAGDSVGGQKGMETVFQALINQGAEAVILGCTEIPIGLQSVVERMPERCIDATALLAQACVDWHYPPTAVAA